MKRSVMKDILQQLEDRRAAARLGGGQRRIDELHERDRVEELHQVQEQGRSGETHSTRAFIQEGSEFLYSKRFLCPFWKRETMHKHH